MRRIISKVITPGEMMPKYYGLAYRDFLRDIAICYPFPFNYVVHIVRRYWIRVRYPRLRDKYAEWARQLIDMEYEKGRTYGYKVGYEKGIKDGKEAIRELMHKEWERIKDER
jgi:hypothetical protein